VSRYAASASDIASTTTLKTVLQIANPASNPASHRIAVYGWRVSASGVGTTDVPLRWLLARQTTAGTGGGTALTVGKLDPSAPASTVVATPGPAAAWTTEPTLGEIMAAQRIHAQAGASEYIPLSDEIIVAPGGWLAILVHAAVAVNVTAQLMWREGY
jgi:hypothetical protein